MTLQMNQFSQAPLKGALAMLLNPFTLSVQLDPDSEAASVKPGDYVKLVSADGPQIIVDICAATDVSIGSVIYVPKKQAFEPADTFEIAGLGSIVWMEASGAISRGDQLEFVPSNIRVKTNAGNPVCGLALDNATGTGALLRVLVLTPQAVPTVITGGSINNTPIGGSTPSSGAFTTLSATGNVALGNAAGDTIDIIGILDVSGATIKGAIPFVFEGATADAFEGSLAVPDFTADQTYTLPDATGTFDLLHQTPLVITPGATPSWTPGASRALSTLTPAENETIAAVVTGAVIGKRYVIKVTTSGTDSYTLTFGTNFKTTGTLATGTDTAKVFIIEFVFDGTNFVEVSRTTAM